MNHVLRGIKETELFRAKVEVLHIDNCHWKPYGHTYDSWCVEVNHPPLDSYGFVGDWTAMRDRFELVFAIAKSFGLHPHIHWKRRDGSEVHAPSGGGHLHIGIDLFNGDVNNLIKLGHLQRLLCLDFAQRPYIRWLFSQWFDNTNTLIPRTLGRLKEIEGHLVTHPSETLFGIHQEVINSWSINPRFGTSFNGKNCLPTWEMRFMDASMDYEELRFQVSFLHQWVNYYVDGLNRNLEECEAFIKRHDTFSLTQESFLKLLSDPAHLKTELSLFFLKIGLDTTTQVWQTVISNLMKRNLTNRISFGKTWPEAPAPESIPAAADVVEGWTISTGTPYVLHFDPSLVS